MNRFAALALCSAACGRSAGVVDQELPGLVVEARRPETAAEAAIDLARAATDPAELGRALLRPYGQTLAALGPHRLVVSSASSVTEAGKAVSELAERAQLDLGDDGQYHGVYTNTADYGRETTFAGGTLYLRPRYQRWHARAPETRDEPAALRDQYAAAIGATWELIAPGVELVDHGPIDIAGHLGRKIELRRAARPAEPAVEALTQRKWRERRIVSAVAGEVVLDAAKGVPLAVKLSGEIGFVRDGRTFAMKVSAESAVTGLGTPSVIAAPTDADVVATPERLREVDDRDFLLQGIAPPLRRNPDGTAIAPTPTDRRRPTSQGAPPRAPAGGKP